MKLLRHGHSESSISKLSTFFITQGVPLDFDVQ